MGSKVSLMNINPYVGMGYYQGTGMGYQGMGFGDYSLFFNNPEFLYRQDNYRQTGYRIEMTNDARESTLEDSIHNFLYFVREDRTDDAMEQYDELLIKMEQDENYQKLIITNEDGTKNYGRLQSKAKQKIEQAIRKSGSRLDLQSYIDTYASGPWMRGLGINDTLPSTTSNDLIERTCGAPVGTFLDPVKRAAGNGVTFGAIGGIAGGILCGTKLGAMVGTTVGGPMGTLIGSIIGFGIGAGLSLWRSVGSWLFGGSKTSKTTQTQQTTKTTNPTTTQTTQTQQIPETDAGIISAINAHGYTVDPDGWVRIEGCLFTPAQVWKMLQPKTTNPDAITGAAPKIPESASQTTPEKKATVVPTGHTKTSTFMTKGFAY